jgi:hypothetical protein
MPDEYSIVEARDHLFSSMEHNYWDALHYSGMLGRARSA